MWWGGEHPIDEVFKYAFFHFMSVEAVSILIDIGLQVADGMVDTSKPGFEHHDTAVQLGEVLSFLL